MADQNQNENLESQVNLQNQLNQILNSRQKILKNINRSMGEQANLATALAEATKKVSDQSQAGANSTSNLHESLKKAAESAGNFGNNAEAIKNAKKSMDEIEESTTDFNKTFTKSIEKAESFGDIFDALKERALSAIKAWGDEAVKSGKKLGILKGAAVALTGGNFLASMSSIGSSLFDTYSGIFKGIFNIARGVFGAISAGGDMLAEMASKSAGGGADPIRQAWEEVKKTISTVGPAFSKVQIAVSGMGMAGASVRDMFGRGRQGMAAAIKYTGQMATEFGHTFNKVASDFATNVDTFVLSNKALNISTDAMSKMQLIAAHRGEKLSDMLNRQNRQAVHLARKFGINAKLIGKNLDEMAKDYSTFGGLSSEAFASTAAYASKLGVSIKDLQSLTSKTDSFEGAAEAAAGLASTFGMAVDTMELMNADPAEKAEMIRQAFLATGQSFEDMSRQEKARMADLAGVSQDALAGMFDPAAEEATLDDFNNASKAAAKSAITQSEANAVLARSIDRVVESMGGSDPALGHGGILKTFLAGIAKGITTTPAFIRIIENLRDTLKMVYYAGIEVGKMLEATFPGLHDFFIALGDFYDPARWRGLLNDLVKEVGIFLNALGDPNANVDQATQDFLDNMLASFNKHFDGIGTKMSEAIVKMIDAMAAIFVSLVPRLAGYLVEFIGDVASALSGKTKKKEAGGGKRTIGGALSDALLAGIPVLTDALTTVVWAAIKGTAKVLWGNKKILAALVVPWIIGLAVALAKAYLMFRLKLWAINKIAKKEIATLGETMRGAAKDTPSPKSSKAVGKSLSSVIKSFRDIKLSDIGRAFLAGIALAAFIGGALITLAGALWVTSKILSKVPTEDLIKSFAALAATLISVKAMIKILKGIDIAEVAKAGMAMFVASLFVGISMATFAGALWVTGKIIGDLSYDEIKAAIAGLSATLVAIYALAKMTKNIKIRTLVEAGKGLLAAAIFFGITSGAFALALRAVAWAYGDLNFEKVKDILSSIGVAILSLVGLIPAGLILGLAAGFLIPAGLGLAAAAGFLAVAGGVFAEALNVMVTKFGSTDLNRVTEILEAIFSTIKVIAGLAAIGGAAAILDKLKLLKPMINGINLASEFLIHSSSKFAMALKKSLNSFQGIRIDKVEKVISAMSGALKLTAGMGALAAGFRVFMRVINELKKGVEAARDFALTSFGSVGKIVKAIEAIPVMNPERLSKTMDAIGKIMKSIQDISGVGLSVAGMGAISKIFGGPSPKELVKSANSFISASATTLALLVGALAAIAGKMKPRALQGAKAITGMLTAVATLMSGLSGPVTEVLKNDGVLNRIVAVVTKTNRAKLSNVISGMKELITHLKVKIVELVTSLFKSKAALL
jgi:translation initiation factor 2 beta subunit (eIF-2beta)/eIF-5